jgi:hypothetical protein
LRRFCGENTTKQKPVIYTILKKNTGKTTGRLKKNQLMMNTKQWYITTIGKK